MAIMHLWIEEPHSEGEGVSAAATLEHVNGQRERLWFRLSSEHSEHLTTRADPFVIGVVFPLMVDALNTVGPVKLEVHGTVSRSLIGNLEEFQRAWAMWRPDLYAIGAIRGEVENEVRPRSPGEEYIMCFSGGVDSSFTAHMHSTPGRTSRPRLLSAGVMVQGWEYGLDEVALFNRAEERSRRIIGSLDIPLIQITTNYRQVVSGWSHSHGAALASCLSILQRSFQGALIAQTMTYGNNHLSLEGVNPMTDWLFSSDAFSFVPDGAGYSRLEKIRAISDWPEFLENVRVCWEDEVGKSENCCACEKCIRTILQFRVLELGLPSAFPRDVSDRQIETLPMSERRLKTTFEPILKEAADRNIKASWVRTLERAVKRARSAAKTASLPRWRKMHYLAWRKAKSYLPRV